MKKDSSSGTILAFMYSFIVSLFPVTILTNHYNLGFVAGFIWFLITMVITIYFVNIWMIIHPFVMIWALIVLWGHFNISAILYYITCFIYFANMLLAIIYEPIVEPIIDFFHEKHKTHKIQNSKQPHSSQPDEVQRAGVIIALMIVAILILVFYIIGLHIQLNEVESNHVSESSVETAPPKYSYDTPSELFEAVQRNPKKYINSIVTVSGYANYQGVYRNCTNSFILLDDQYNRTTSFENAVSSNPKKYQYSIIKPYEASATEDYVLDNDYVTVTGTVRLSFEEDSNCYVPFFENVESIKIQK